jgi:hypothetical protein
VWPSLVKPLVQEITAGWFVFQWRIYPSPS